MTETKRILIVDDEESVLFVLNGALARASDRFQLEVEMATDGEEALSKALEGHFDLLITDIRLPGMNGVELTERVGQEIPATSVIWITAHGSRRLSRDSERLGVHMCLDKPLEIGQIREAVKAALGESEPAGSC